MDSRERDKDKDELKEEELTAEEIEEEASDTETDLDEESAEDLDEPTTSESEEDIQEEALEEQVEDSAEHTLEDLTESKERDLEEPRPKLDEDSAPVPSISNTNSKDYFFDKSAKSNKGSVIHLVILIILGIAVISTAVYLLKGGTFNFPSGQKPSPSPVASDRPSPAETLRINTPIERSKYVVRVLNGSGKTGLAASVSARLKDLGYQIERTGNAPSSDNPQTTVTVKVGLEGLMEQLVKDLTGSFEATGTASLRSSEEVDAEIILGAK